MRLLPSILLTLAVFCPASAAAMTPISVLQARHLTVSAEFVLAHASYQLYRVRWAGSGVRLSGLFANEAQTAAQATQVRTIEWSVPLSSFGRLSRAQTRALVVAAQATASACLNLRLGGLPTALTEATSKASRQASVELPFGPGQTVSIGLGDAGQPRDLRVSLHLPAGQRPRCLLPQ